MARTRRNRLCAHEGCKEPGEPYERWGYGFTFCSTHMEHAREVFNGENPGILQPPPPPKIVIPPDAKRCSRGHAIIEENRAGRGCRACNNAQAWAWSRKIADPYLIQRRADARYLKIIGAKQHDRLIRR